MRKLVPSHSPVQWDSLTLALLVVTVHDVIVRAMFDPTYKPPPFSQHMIISIETSKAKSHAGSFWQLTLYSRREKPTKQGFHEVIDDDLDQ
jgi:hypothetical protein